MNFFKRLITPPKSIRKFQPKKLGNISWWKDFGKEVALPAAAIGMGAGMLGVGPLTGLGTAIKGTKIGGALAKSAGKLGSWAIAHPEKSLPLALQGIEAVGEGRHADQQMDMAQQYQDLAAANEARQQEQWEYSQSPEALMKQLLMSGAWKMGRY